MKHNSDRIKNCRTAVQVDSGILRARQQMRNASRTHKGSPSMYTRRAPDCNVEAFAVARLMADADFCGGVWLCERIVSARRCFACAVLLPACRRPVLCCAVLLARRCGVAACFRDCRLPLLLASDCCDDCCMRARLPALLLSADADTDDRWVYCRRPPAEQ